MKTENNKIVKKFNKFVEKYNAFVAEMDSADYSLYEDANTPYYLENIKVLKTCVKFTTTYNDYWHTTYNETVTDELDLDEWISKFNADLRRAKRYFAMSMDELDAICDGNAEDIE